MPYVILTPDQFEVLEQACEKSDKIGKLTTTGTNTGVIDTHDVTIDYTYDPLRQTLNFNIGAKHSLAARVAGDNVIANHIVALIHGLEYPSVSVKVIPPVATEPPVTEPIAAATAPEPAIIAAPVVPVKPVVPATTV